MSMVVLQNCINLPKVVPSSYSETSLTSSHDDNQVIDIKAEDVTDIQEEEEEDPLLITSPVIKAENEVSCMSVYIVRHFSEIYIITCCLSHLHLSFCLST
jgi:hypothetical protein